MRPFNALEEKNIKILTSENIEMGFLMPTATGLGKSIMDATAPVRLFLRKRSIHNYETQQQGPEYKKAIPAFIAKENDLISSQASLYRPITKKGDPRIWFAGLKDYVEPNDILGIVDFDKKIYVLNLTKLNIERILIQGHNSPVASLIRSINQSSNEIAQELLAKIKAIAARGLIRGIGTGDTAIGRTLETLLNIPINSSRAPDYKGIELKSFRDKRGTRKNLFAQVADWNLSKFKSTTEILNNFGYKRGDEFKLYCTVNALKPNSQGLFLKVDEKVSHLVESSNKQEIGDFAVWQLANLHTALETKHKETFWIAADASFSGAVEYFRFKMIEHTRSPITSQFDLLLGRGIITLDHLIKRQPSGHGRDKGPIFKIHPKKLDMLFPPSIKYNLL